MGAAPGHEAPLTDPAARLRLLLEASRQLGELIEPEEVYDRFHELLADTIQHDGVIVSSYDPSDGLIRCEYAWVEGEHIDPALLPALPLNPGSGGMQSQVIHSGEPLLVTDVGAHIAGATGTYYDVDRHGTVRKVPDTGPPETQAAMMVPVKHKGQVVGVVQLMTDRPPYTLEQLEVFEGLVGQMAAAVRNARLNAERRRLEAAEAAARAIAAEREQAAHVLEAVGDGIFLVDEAGVVRLWNRAAEVVTGLSRDEVVGRDAPSVFPTWETLAGSIPVAEGGIAARSVTHPVDFGHGELWLSFVAVVFPAGTVYAFRDLTAERRLDEAKSDFIATVSHELRTPMAAVYGAAQTLLHRGDALPEESRNDLLEVISTQASRLSQITEEVLLASRLDRGDMPLERESVDLSELARTTVAAMRSGLPDGVSLDLVASEGLGAVGDRDRIEQVLVNLIDNAIKYSPGGGAVTVSAARGNGTVRVSVTDEGLGVPAAEQARIFEKFYRVDPLLTHAPGGSGLGLYISRELVQRMGGRIDVTSTPGEGSTFAFELPADAGT
jgi:signal transduction histidine kinase